MHIHWGLTYSQWVIDDDLDDERRLLCFTKSSEQPDALPPAGAWREWCEGQWIDVTVTLAELESPPTPATAINVSGLRCHSATEGSYALQPDLQNGKPRWTQTGDGSHHLYWSSPSNLWIIDNDLDDEFRQLFIHASTSLPPVGLYGEWREWCDGEWTPSTLTLAEVIRSENLFSLSFPFW